MINPTIFPHKKIALKIELLISVVDSVLNQVL